MHNFMSEIPRDLLEAARIDGASHGQIFRQIMLPLLRPALAAFGIFQFLWVWNDLFVGIVMSGGNPGICPITVSIANLQNAHVRRRAASCFRRRRSSRSSSRWSCSSRCSASSSAACSRARSRADALAKGSRSAVPVGEYPGRHCPLSRCRFGRRNSAGRLGRLHHPVPVHARSSDSDEATRRPIEGTQQ